MQIFYPERFEEGISYLSHKMLHKLRQGLVRTCEAMGYRVTPEALVILFVLRREKEISQRQLVEVLAKDKAAVTRLLNGLVAQKWVKRRHDASDRRVVHASLTRKGEAALQAMEPQVVSYVHEQVLAGIDADDIAVARSVLRRMIDNLS